jgi:hypothetical protein
MARWMWSIHRFMFVCYFYAIDKSKEDPPWWKRHQVTRRLAVNLSTVLHRQYRSPELSSLRSCIGGRRIRFRALRATARKRLLHLLLSGLLPVGRSRDYTAYIFMDRRCTTTSTEVLPRLVWLIQRITVHWLPQQLPHLWVHSLYCGFFCSSCSACTNRAYTSCYDIWYEFAKHA